MSNTEQMTIQHIPTAEIYPSPLNNRTNYQIDEEFLQSIRTQGILQPVTVRKNSVPGYEKMATWELILGGRRYRAAMKLNMPTMPCIPRELTDEQAREMILVENLQRKDVDAIEEANGYRALIEQHKYSYAHLAKRIGKSKNYIHERMQMLKLIPAALKCLEDKKLSFGNAVQLSRLKPDQQLSGLSFLRGSGLPIDTRSFAGWINQKIKGQPATKSKAKPHRKTVNKNIVSIATGRKKRKAKVRRVLGVPVTVPRLAPEYVDRLRTATTKKVSSMSREKAIRILKTLISNSKPDFVPAVASVLGVNVKQELARAKKKAGRQ